MSIAARAEVGGKALLIRLLAWFLPMAASVVTITFLYTQGVKQKTIIVHSANEHSAILVGKTSLAHRLQDAARDLQFIQRIFKGKHLCDKPSSYQVHDFKRVMINLSMAENDYDQIRWIGKDGMERLRLNANGGHPAFVASSQLQNKKGRYYFADTLSLSPGSIYLSPFDLNIEHGKIELPYKPTLRIGTPVTNANGHKCGIILLNYLGADIIAQFVQQVSPLDPGVMLLNQDGYYLRSPRSEDEWGFMFGRKDLSLAYRFPAAWQRMATREHGQFIDDAGLWTFATVHPDRDIQATGTGAPQSQHEQWKIVSHLTHHELFAAYYAKRKKAWVRAAGLLALLLFLSWRLAQASITRERLEQALAVQAAEYQDLYDFAPCGYHSIDKDGNIIRVNQTELDWLGYTHDELIGKHFTIMHMNPDHDLIVKKLAAIDEHRSIDNMEFDLRRKDGTSFPVSLSLTPVYDDDGRFMFSRSVLFDLRYRKELEHRLEIEARNDPLTGLNNRRSFYEMSERELSRTRRLGSPLALMLFDIDFFKKVNDRYGHDIGDAVLKSCAQAAIRTLRQNDVLARWGGEEFVVLLPDIDGKQAMEAAERLRETLAIADVEISSTQRTSYTVSIGVTSQLDSSESIEVMIKRADNALYAAKQAGRNCVRRA